MGDEEHVILISPNVIFAGLNIPELLNLTENNLSFLNTESTIKNLYLTSFGILENIRVNLVVNAIFS